MGRNFEEIQRIIIGLQLAATAPIALPVNWTCGRVRTADGPVFLSRNRGRGRQGSVLAKG